jgi:Asp-tRNA(Asn)/Glu-tRNA(Gln) amidotransferase C subunit
MAEDTRLIIQLPAGSALDRQLREDPPPNATDGRVVIEQLPADEDGRITPPEAGEVVLSFLSPEALRRDPEQVRRKIAEVEPNEPPVVVLDVAEELREDELAVLLQAAEQAGRTVILCVLLGTS